jgi:hypothetical protein
MGKIYDYEAVISESKIGKGGAYVVFPYDAYDEFGQKRVKVHATFDGEPYAFNKLGISRIIGKYIASRHHDTKNVAIHKNIVNSAMYPDIATYNMSQ